ncbi:MAG: helix-turn-helix transcriptional regulator [Flavobacteriaceae bacterium]|nr:helix-turn-helix transcriptional regulator [Flavobacteriaceae bacterium]NNK34690.1 helix-turn-helix transcriptional regulator [Eudoraea sp.]NNL39608.1 helix-turn-helix transcriptional regulator [Flavobacteriaceae bacterium]
MKNTIKIQRVTHEMTQEDVAQRLGVSRQTINAIENNKYFPSLELGLKLARIFKCSVEDLFSLEE